METEEKKIYTIEDIARELGVSNTTVSRAISGKGRIGQATRNRVLAFIKEHDYRPNVVARGLAQRKTYNIALLMPKDYVATEFLFFKDCMNGICEVASAHDYDIIISMVDGEDVSQIERLEANRKVDGIIVSRAVVSSKIQKYLKNCREPFVLIGPTSDPDVPFVDNKNQEAGKELTSILLMKGMRHLALLGGNESYNVTGSRYQGFLDAHQELGIPVDKNLIFMIADILLVVSDAVGGGIDHLVVGAFRLQLFDAAEDRFGFHHHACFAAERVVVHLPVPVERVVAQVVHGDFHQPFLLCPLEDRFVQRRYEQFGNDGYDVYSHGFTCS